MSNQVIDAFLAALELRAEVRPEGKGWRTRCPNPDHKDLHPSFFLYPGGGGRCFSRCGRYWSPRELAEILEINLPQHKPGLTLAQLAQAKGLPEDFLRSLGVSDGSVGSSKARVPCVDIQYADQHGEVVAIHKRLRLDGDPRFIWRRGDHPLPYGLARLGDIQRGGFVILVEGESDVWTLWHHNIPALGLPGASMWKPIYLELLGGLSVYLWREPDAAGDRLAELVSKDIPSVFIIKASPDAKDPSDVYLQDTEHFKNRIEILVRSAQPASQFHTEALGLQARESFKAAQPLLETPDILTKLGEALAISGYAGDVRPALVAYVAISSRLLEEPLNLAYVSLSAAGKNAAIDSILPFFPGDAFYLVRASSPRALIYNDEPFSHRTVILTEADSLPEEGPAASAMRSLMSDREMAYEVVEKDERGKFYVRRISKPGPTGLITTSIKPLGEQASTRMLIVNIADTPYQTRLILHAQADRSNAALPTQDIAPWVALQRWLALEGEWRTVIPFAHALAEAVPVTALRMRRDFLQLLTVIRVLAMLYQRQRERDAKGRVIATIDDYAQARWLLEEVFRVSISEGLTLAARETVMMVSQLSPNGNPVTERELVEQLGLARSTIHYRVKRALQGGWLVNRTMQRGAPAQLVLGMPLPDSCPLPEPHDLVCVNPPEKASNIRIDSLEPATAQLGGVRRFESKPGGTTHTETPGMAAQTALPWDEFLQEVGEDDSQAG